MGGGGAGRQLRGYWEHLSETDDGRNPGGQLAGCGEAGEREPSREHGPHRGNVRKWFGGRLLRAGLNTPHPT